ncbi:MAG: hypothetical protein EOO38_08870, partial [Cytophagaceae bacterium]
MKKLLSFGRPGLVVIFGALTVGCNSFLPQPSPAVNNTKPSTNAMSVAEEVIIPAQWWPRSPNSKPRIGKDEHIANDKYVLEKINVSQENAAEASLKKTLIEVAEIAHRPFISKVKSGYSSRVEFQEKTKSVGLIDGANAVVVFTVSLKTPPSSLNLNHTVMDYVYALYKIKGEWKVIADYPLLVSQ